MAQKSVRELIPGRGANAAKAVRVKRLARARADALELARDL
jgi:hypothetical protein